MLTKSNMLRAGIIILLLLTSGDTWVSVYGRKSSAGLVEDRVASKAAVDRLTMMTINLWGLPIKLPRHNQSKRFGDIPDALNGIDEDIVCMQEVFSKRLRKRLISQIHTSYYMYSDYTCNKGIIGPFVRDCHGGLMTISKYPIVEETFYEFPLYKGMRLEERIGHKGFLLTKIDLGESFVYVINTHLYAGQKDRDAFFRSMQISYLVAKVRDLNLDESIPLVLLGDLNVEHFTGLLKRFEDDSNNYISIVEGLRLSDVICTLDECLYTINHKLNRYTPDSELPQKLDYILSGPGCTSWVVKDQYTVFEGEDAISDHLGVLAEMVREEMEPEQEKVMKSDVDLLVAEDR